MSVRVEDMEEGKKKTWGWRTQTQALAFVEWGLMCCFGASVLVCLCVLVYFAWFCASEAHAELEPDEGPRGVFLAWA